MSEQVQTTTGAQDISELSRIRREKLFDMQANGHDPYQITTYDVDAHAQTVIDTFDDEAEELRRVSLAGRVMSWRNMGGSSFMDLVDKTGRIQVYVKKNLLPEGVYADMKKHLDIGDIVGVKGEVFRTKMGEVTVRAFGLCDLSKGCCRCPKSSTA